MHAVGTVARPGRGEVTGGATAAGRAPNTEGDHEVGKFVG